MFYESAYHRTMPSGAVSVSLAFLCLFWFGALVLRAADRYVRPPETCTNTILQSPFTSWDTAATNIQWAVDVVTNGETIWVTNGNYRLTNTIIMPTTNVTLKSVNGRDVTFLNGNYPYTTNGCIMVGIDSSVGGSPNYIDGFTITNGHPKYTAETGWGAGGGIYVCDNKECHVRNCTVRSNYSSSSGGGICMKGSVSNCIVEKNYGNTGGGGIATRGGGAGTIANCIISENTGGSSVPGYGILAKNGGITIRNCVVTRNYGAYNGTNGGAGISCTGPTTVENCTIVSNYLTGAASRGGGIGPYAYTAGSVPIHNCIIYSNSTASGLGMNWSTNDAPSDLVFTFTNCCTYPTNDLPGTGNISSEPMFVDYNATNLRLSASSPCINKGVNQSWMTNSYDLDGRTRIRYGIVDMGAYERIYDGVVFSVH